MLERFSPDWVTQKILDARVKVEATLAKDFPERIADKIILLTILGLTGAALTLPSPLNHFSLFFQFSALTAAFLLLLGSWAHKPVFYFTFWFGCVAFFAWEAGSGYYLLALLFSYFCLWLSFYFLRTASYAIRVLSGVGVSIALFLFVHYLIAGPMQLASLIIIRPQRFLFLLLMPLASIPLAGAQGATRLFVYGLFFPANLIFQTPFILDNWRKSEKIWQTKIRGFFDLSIGFAFLLIFYFTSKRPMNPQTALDWLGLGLFAYLETYVMSCGAATIPIGLGRLFGFNMFDAYSLPLLAASPYDRWRRWNTYYYRFYSLLIFYPLARRLRSLFFPVMVTFAASIFFHSFSRNLVEFATDRIQILPLNVVWFFLAHGLAVYVSLRWKFKIYDGTTRLGWFGVAITWVMMIGVHMLNRWGEN